jgi:acyl-coenzyme A synthetase/AMP-(fatty) acid ligase
MHFDTQLEDFPERTALFFQNGTKISYKTLADNCNKLQYHLGTEKKLLLILCKTNRETIVGYLSGLRAGHAVMMISADLDLEFIEILKKRYKPHYIWKSKSDDEIYLYEDGVYGLIEYDVNDEVAIEKDLALLLSTSGSTGSPKFVKLTKKNLYANSTAIVEYLNISKEERAITSLPLHYSFGLSILNTHLAVGASVLVTEKSIISKEFWDFFKQEKATSFSGVPYTYEMLKKIRFFKMELPFLRTLTQAGGKLNEKLVLAFSEYSKKNTIDFYVMYGQTEATARISYLPPVFNESHHKSIGIAIPHGEITLLDEDGEAISAENKVGELLYSGENVMMGYATCRQDLGEADTYKGVLKTGDLAYKDKDGLFYITGRIKRYIKLFGNRVNLDEVEQNLKTQGFECLCVGEDDLLKVAVLEDSQIESIKSYIVNKYKFHPKSINIEVVASFPITSSGKIEYQKLLKKLKSVKYG